MSIRDFRVDMEEFDEILWQALELTYSATPSFASEADFKYELFHQLHGLEVGGYKLGEKLQGRPTCMLHAEANAVNGLRGKSKRADLIVCDPTDKREFNYKVRIAVELKKSLNSYELSHELDKFAGYSNTVPRLYIVSANHPRVEKEVAMRVISKHQPSRAIIEVLDRTVVIDSQGIPASVHKVAGKPESRFVERVTECIKEVLDLYGKNSRDPYHSFFWRNYEHEIEKGWTFPCEGDFTAQLYHRLRSQLTQCAIRPEYRTPSAARSRVDLFVDGGDESVGIEVKINYDNFKGKAKKAETVKLSRKFQAMSRDHNNHVNVLVVIQGQDAHKGDNKRNTLAGLAREDARFGLMYYDEREKKAVGPVELR